MRQALAAIAAVLVVAAVVVTGYRSLEAREEQVQATDDGPETTVDAYLRAWSDGDHAAMADLVRDAPETFEADHAQLREGLGLDALEVVRTGLVEDVDGRATATAAVTAAVPDVGEVSWDVEVRLLRERGDWGVSWSPSSLHPEWRHGLRFVTTQAATGRAPILATDGTPLAGPGQRVTFGFEPTAVAATDEVVAAFDAAVPGAGETAERLLSQDGLVDGWFYPVVSLSAEQAADAAGTLSGVPGILRRTEDAARSLLADGFAVHVVGRTGEATAEELEELGPPYEPGDVVGRTGLEEAFEARLAEHEEVRVELRDGADGPVRATLATGGDDTTDGEDARGPVTTTLDVGVQRAIENALLGRDTATAMVVVDAADGAIRGSASRPLDGFNRAFEGRYPPGTAISPIVVEALVAADGDPTAAAACPAEAVVAGRRIRNVGEVALGEVPLPAAAAAGCATSLAALGAELGGDALTAAAARFGAGQDPALPLFANGLSFPTPVDLGEVAVAASGQGVAEVSPLHLASVAAATSSGRWRPPYLLEEAAGGAPTTLTPGALDGFGRLYAGSDAVVEEGLTGIAGPARGRDGAIHRWFVGTVDDLGIAVLVEDEGEGADPAAPLAERFVRELRALAEIPVDEDR